MANNSTQLSMFNIPEVKLSSSSGQRKMPVVGLGSVVDKLDENAMKIEVLEAIKLGYRHFDTASIYGSEKALGGAIAEALRLGLASSREELFITSKLWCNDGHCDLVVPALKQSLRWKTLTCISIGCDDGGSFEVEHSNKNY